MLITQFESIYCKIFDSIDNPYLNNEDIVHIIDSDCSLTYNPNFFCIINREKLGFEYIGKNMHGCIGLHETELKENGLNYIWNRIHPQDLNCLFAAFDKILVFIKKLHYSNKQQFSYSWNYRFKKHDGKYINMIQSTTPFFLTENNLKKGLIRFQVINSEFKIPIRASLNLLSQNGDSEIIYTDNCSQNSFLKNISKRENDVIKLLVKDKTSKFIGKKLFISSNTVDTHRRNILKKLKLSSTGELVNILKTNQTIL